MSEMIVRKGRQPWLREEATPGRREMRLREACIILVTLVLQHVEADLFICMRLVGILPGDLTDASFGQHKTRQVRHIYQPEMRLSSSSRT